MIMFPSNQTFTTTIILYTQTLRICPPHKHASRLINCSLLYIPCGKHAGTPVGTSDTPGNTYQHSGNMATRTGTFRHKYPDTLVETPRHTCENIHHPRLPDLQGNTYIPTWKHPDKTETPRHPCENIQTSSWHCCGNAIWEHPDTRMGSSGYPFWQHPNTNIQTWTPRYPSEDTQTPCGTTRTLREHQDTPVGTARLPIGTSNHPVGNIEDPLSKHPNENTQIADTKGNIHIPKWEQRYPLQGHPGTPVGTASHPLGTKPIPRLRHERCNEKGAANYKKASLKDVVELSDKRRVVLKATLEN